MASRYRLRHDIADQINEMEALQDKLRRVALAEAANDSLLPNVASSSSVARRTSFSREESSGDNAVYEASPARELIARSLRNTHKPPPHDRQPDGDTDSGDEADDEESPFGDFLEGSPQFKEEADAEAQEIRVALEYLRGVLTAARTQDAPSHEGAGHKSTDEMGVRDKDGDVEEEEEGEDGFVMVEGEDDDKEIQDMTETCLDLVSKLDCVMFPTVDVVDFLREGELEVMLIDDDDCAVNGSGAASLSARVRSKWQLLYEKFYDEDNKVFKEADVEHWGREVVQACGDVFRDVSRRLHRLKNGC